jgi:O-antigen/teichoic acid export membrane protein
MLEGPIVRNAATLWGTTIVTSALGFVYWLIAARLVSERAIGIASAIQSAAQFLSLFCVLGLNTLVVSELSKDKTQGRGLILTAGGLVGTFTLLLAGIVGFGLSIASSRLRPGLMWPSGIIIFVLISIATSVLIVLDDSCIGLLRGDLQLKRNAVFAVSKLAILPLLIFVWRSSAGLELEGAWLAGLIFSFATLAWSLGKATRGQSSHLWLKDLFEKRGLVLAHYALNLSILSPGLINPIIVTLIVGAEANARYTIAIFVVSVVNIIPIHLSTVLFALIPGDEVALRHEVRKTMRICLILAVLSAPFFVLTSGFILGLFGRSYVGGEVALAIFGLTTYPYAIKTHYVAISRIRGRMRRAAIWTMAGAALEISLAAIGAISYGVTGVAAGILTALVLETSFFAPTVYGVLRVSPIHLKNALDLTLETGAEEEAN